MRRFTMLITAGALAAASAGIAGPPATPGHQGQAAGRMSDRARAALLNRAGLHEFEQGQVLGGNAAGRRRDAGSVSARALGPQAGSGRFGQDGPTERRSGLETAERARSRFQPNHGTTDADGDDARSARLGPPADRGERRYGPDLADHLLAQRLAAIDHMRDVALDNGNLELLERADELEALARRQHARRTGELEPQGIGIGLFRIPPDADSEPTEPPVVEPPLTEPPTSEPPLTEPPLTEPPVTEAE
ncbi:MAG TPA: hypothetical protein VML55_17665 [Planctomycetaceae bacterium]|nr:hypothetical protein [Planctomycetaceae bacterium]